MRKAETVTFGGSALNRADALRGEAAQASLLPAGRFVALWQGKALMSVDGRLHYLPQGHPVLVHAEEIVFVGQVDGNPTYAADVSGWTPDPGQESPESGFLDQTVQRHPDLDDDVGFQELRAVMTQLAPTEADVFATARAILHWHRSHRFCSACGAASASAHAGWRRHCAACGTDHFPRTDPVVIMLVLHANHVLLGRNANWPPGMYSLLAGFVEPGETIEAAVRREVHEEAGVSLGKVGYLSSQPWPFPASLMIGCRAEATSTAITLDPAELEDARWISREDLLVVMAGDHPEIRPPRKGAIAEFLMTAWLADQLGD